MLKGGLKAGLVLCAALIGLATMPAKAQDRDMERHMRHRMMRHEMHRDMRHERHRMMRHEMRRRHMMHRMMRHERHGY